MFTNNEHNDGLAHGEHVAQNADFVQSVQRPASDVGVPVVAPGNHASTLSNSSENKPETNISNPAADTTSAAPNLNKKDKDMKANMHHNDKPAHHNGENHKDNHKDNHKHDHGHGKPQPLSDDETSEGSAISAQNEDEVAPIAETEESVPAGKVIFEASYSHSEMGNESYPGYSGSFTVPKGGANASASLTVDDWGSLEITGSGGSLKISLTSAESAPGPLGGHKAWSGNDSAFLEEGTYSVTVTHQNISMDNPNANASICSFSISVVAVGYTPDEQPSSSSSSSPDSSSSSSSPMWDSSSSSSSPDSSSSSSSSPDSSSSSFSSVLFS